MKSKFIILILSVLVGLLDLCQTYIAYGRENNFDIDIEKYKKEAKGLISYSHDPKLADTAKGLKGFTDNPEEASLTEDELRIKGDEKIKGKDKSREEDKGVREAINSVKNDNATNPHRSKYTVTKLKNKNFIKKSGAIIENPISGLNVAANAECRVIGGDKGGENVSFEEYWVDVEDSRIKEVQQTCEEDEDQLFYCNRSIKDVQCASKINCGYNAGGIEEGSVDTGIDWDYSYPYLRLGSKTPDSSNEEDWHFRCGSRTCCDKRSRSARLRIKDLNNVKKFILHKISYDDYALVKINGVTVHNTLGGSYLDITRRYWGSDRDGDNDRIISSGVGSGPCWRLYPGNGFNHYDYVGKDVKHYLREGVNEIEIELVFAQLGQVNVVFEAEQYCCKEWSDEWETDCPVN